MKRIIKTFPKPNFKCFKYIQFLLSPARRNDAFASDSMPLKIKVMAFHGKDYLGNDNLFPKLQKLPNSLSVQ